MTYSRRIFIPLGRIAPHPKYRFFKFIDARDPRHRPYRSGSAPLRNDTGWCMNVPTVIYVPGHFGSYEQSRSLGAHGVQLTEKYGGNLKEKKALERLKAATLSSPYDEDAEHFLFDVYAVDFREEGGAFHGSLLRRQAAYIAQVVEQLAARCGTQNVYIVAHSIGGISSRLAIQQYEGVARNIKHILTIGTPHHFPVWTWDPSIWNVYAQLHQKPTEKTILSVSGGLRDEMIPPEACYIGDNHTTVLWTEFADGSGLGADHRAIVWCHELMKGVRSTILTLQRLNGSAEIRMKWPFSDSKSYANACDEMSARIRVSSVCAQDDTFSESFD